MPRRCIQETESDSNNWRGSVGHNADGDPRLRFGKAADTSGLYFAGLRFQYAVSFTIVAGVGYDAERVAGRIAAAGKG